LISIFVFLASTDLRVREKALHSLVIRDMVSSEFVVFKIIFIVLRNEALPFDH